LYMKGSNWALTGCLVNFCWIVIPSFFRPFNLFQPPYNLIGTIPHFEHLLGHF